MISDKQTGENNMASLNRAQILGRLGKDVELRYTTSGTATASLTVATSEKYKNKQSGEWEEKTEWHRVVLWGRLAEVAGEYLAKGKQVLIEGRLQTRKWTDRDGNERYTTEIVGTNMQMFGGGANSKGDGSTVDQAQMDTAFEDSMGEIPF